MLVVTSWISIIDSLRQRAIKFLRNRTAFYSTTEVIYQTILSIGDRRKGLVQQHRRSFELVGWNCEGFRSLLLFFFFPFRILFLFSLSFRPTVMLSRYPRSECFGEFISIDLQPLIDDVGL